MESEGLLTSKMSQTTASTDNSNPVAYFDVGIEDGLATNQ
jgi:hypothetical protein